MYCPKCDTEAPQNAKFCSQCGGPLVQKNESAAAQQSTPLKTKAASKGQSAAKKGRGLLYAGLSCAVILIITIILALWGIIAIKRKINEELKNNPSLNQSMPGPSGPGTSAGLKPKSGSPSHNLSGSSPETVVTNFMLSTLGSIPNAQFDSEKAKEYVTTPLRARFQNPGFIPQTYCIQDGPSDVKIESVSLAGEEAVIEVSANYGGTWQKMWEFDLVQENSAWLIDAIKCLAVN